MVWPIMRVMALRCPWAEGEIRPLLVTHCPEVTLRPWSYDDDVAAQPYQMSISSYRCRIPPRRRCIWTYALQHILTSVSSHAKRVPRRSSQQLVICLKDENRRDHAVSPMSLQAS
jgi:hypothetical protein